MYNMHWQQCCCVLGRNTEELAGYVVVRQHAAYRMPTFPLTTIENNWVDLSEYVALGIYISTKAFPN